jgi:hypothetical protein
MNQKGWTDYNQLYQYFVGKAQDIAKGLTSSVNP